MTTLTVVRSGWVTTFQDHGRPGLAHLGVPRAGAVDRPLADLVTRLVGNPVGTALLETVGGLEIVADGPIVVASSIDLAPTVVAGGQPVRVPAGGGRNYHYLAIRGGLDVEPVLGSASHDTLSGIGPPAVVDGSTYSVGPEPPEPLVVDVAPLVEAPTEIRLWPGPRLDMFEPTTWDRLCSTVWTVSASLSRVGVRLDGVRLERRVEAELPSEGLVLGAVQVPHDGRPVVMLADHPTTGGYPVAAVVEPEDLPAVAQRPPGRPIRFVPTHRRLTRRS